MKIIETKRLILRTWEKSDAEKYFAINQDKKVIEYLPKSPTMEEVFNFFERMNKQQNDKNYTLWATELKNTGDLIGYIGLNYTDFPANFTPAIEVGWRLGYQYWGNGYASEGALAALDYAFNKLNIKEIVSFTVPENIRSIRVMEKIGMKRDMFGDFKHPNLSPEHRLSNHVLYRIKKS